jgi:hypothetical protein
VCTAPQYVEDLIPACRARCCQRLGAHLSACIVLGTGAESLSKERLEFQRRVDDAL